VPYYMGDYYRGDPFWAGLLGGAAKLFSGFGKATGVAKGLLGVPTGGGGATKVAMPIIKRGAERVLAKIKAHPVLTGAGAAGAVAGAGALAARIRSGRGRGGGGAAHHKRMNVCNPRALRRAIRRTHGFAKLAMRTIHLVHPKKKVRFGGFRRKRARKS